MNVRSFLLLLVVVGIPLSESIAAQDAAQAFDAAWTGTWKLKPGSTLLGERFVFAVDADGTSHRTTYYSRDVAAKPTSRFDTPCNGAEAVSVDDPTFSWSCRKTSDSLFEFTGKRRGALYTSVRYEVSDDGQTMTSEQKSAGQTAALTTHYARLTGTSGLSGEWISRCDACTSTVQVLAVADGIMHIDYRDYRSTVEAKFGGPKATWTGDTGRGLSIGLTREKPFLIHFVEASSSGEELLEGSLSLDNAATTLTQVVWFPGQEDAKTTYLYEKQP